MIVYLYIYTINRTHHNKENEQDDKSQLREHSRNRMDDRFKYYEYGLNWPKVHWNIIEGFCFFSFFLEIFSGKNTNRSIT